MLLKRYCSMFLLFAQIVVAQSNAPSPLVMAEALRNRGEYGEAIAMLEPFVQSLGSQATDSAKAWILLGSIYQDVGQYEQAQHAYQHAISISRERPGCETEEAVALDNLGSLFLELGQPDMSKRLRLRVLHVAQNTGDHAFMAKIYNNLTAISLQQREDSEARRWINRALAEVKLAPHIDADNLAAIFSNAGWVSVHDHEYQRASDYYDAALQYWIEQHGTNHQLTGWGYVLRGRIRALRGETEPGLGDVEMGIAIIERKLGTGVPLYLAARLAYSDVLSIAGSRKQAESVRSQTVRAIQSLLHSKQSSLTISADAFR